MIKLQVQRIERRSIKQDPCPLCGDTTFLIITEKPSRVIECENCSFSFRSHRPSPVELEQYYSWSQSPTHQEGENKLRERETKWKVKLLSQMVNLNRVQSLLDIGCDDGLFLFTLKRNFPHLEVFGVEPSERRVRIAKEIYGLKNIETGLCEKADIKRTFDLITAFHVLEHVHDPIKFLQKIKSVMNLQSLLCLQVPTVSLSRIDLPLGIRFLLPGYFFSEHLWFFTPKTFAVLLEQQEFSIKTMRFDSFGIQPSLNSFVMRYMPWLFPVYEQASRFILFPFISFNRGPQVTAIVYLHCQSAFNQDNSAPLTSL
ncbi:class I SAM-dependent methyltransferase [Dehalococcoidia bacterium]|nr:class I SAM-dependent methyltransferase [Dehalococcoidia bacterium]